MADREHNKGNGGEKPSGKVSFLPGGIVDDEELRNRYDPDAESEETTGKRKKPHLRRVRGRARNKNRTVHIVDAVILLLILAALMTLVVGFDTIRGVFVPQAAPKQTNLVYTVVFYRVEARFADAISEGDSVSLDGSESASMGTVDSILKEPAKILSLPTDYSPGETAVGVLTEDESGAYDLTITIRVPAQFRSGSGYTVDDQDIRIAAGNTYALRFPRWVGEGICVQISTIAEGGK